MSNKPKIKKIRVEKPSDAVVALSKESLDFIKLGEANKIDFTVWFVMFNMWLKLPISQKEAIIVNLIKDGKVDIGEDVRKDSEGK